MLENSLFIVPLFELYVFIVTLFELVRLRGGWLVGFVKKKKKMKQFPHSTDFFARGHNCRAGSSFILFSCSVLTIVVICGY